MLQKSGKWTQMRNLTPVMKVKDTFMQTESKDEISSWMEMNSILYPTFVHFTFGLFDYFLM